METFSFVSGPFVFLDWALPFILFLVSALILTSNFATKTFFDRCGIGLHGRYFFGVMIVFLGVALMIGFEALATQALIVMLIALALLATRRGGSREVALANLAIAAILIPVAIIP